MPPFFLPKSIKIASKLRLGRHQCLYNLLNGRFTFDLGRELKAMVAPMARPRRLQNASKTPSRYLQDGSQDEVRDIFRSSADVCWFLVMFHSMFDCFWVGFWLIFQRFLVDLGLISHRCCLLIFCSSAVADTQLCCALDIENMPALTRLDKIKSEKCSSQTLPTTIS